MWVHLAREAIGVRSVSPGSGRSPRSTTTLTTLGLIIALSCWTLLTSVTPWLLFDLRGQAARLRSETVGVIVAGLAAALAYLRYWVTGVPALLFVSLRS